MMECKLPEPEHVVVETEEALYVDDKRIRFVFENSVKTEPFGGYVKVTLSFIAKEYHKKGDNYNDIPN